MAIMVRCECKTELSLSSKKCPKCGKPISSRKKVYKVVLRDRGRKVTRTVSNLNLAREVEAKLKLDISRGELNLTRKKAVPTLDTIWKRYLPWAKENKKSWKTDYYYFEKHLGPAFGEKPLDRISPFDIEKLMLNMKKGVNQHGKPYAAATIKHQVVLLSRLYSLAQKWGRYSGPNPCMQVKKARVNNQITEFLSRSEIQRLFAVLETWPERMSVSIIKFAIFTGLRRGELFNLQWTDVDLDRKTVSLKNPKGGKDQVLPISDKAIAVLENVPHRYESPYIFYGTKGRKRTNFKGPWLRIRKAAGLPDNFRFHGLRHHFASTLASQGVDLYVIQKLLTHKDASTTQRYAHLTNQALRNAVSISDKMVSEDEDSTVISLKENRNG